jgi:hypothetical protein
MVDEMVGCDAVEDHAAIAKRKGRDITMVGREKSAHCGKAAHLKVPREQR